MERMPTMCIKLPSIQWAGVAAALATILLLHGPAAQAGEVTTRNCLHGFTDSYRSAESQSYSGEYGSDYGDSRSYSRSNSDSRRGFRGGFRRAGSHGGFMRGGGNGHGIAGGSGSRAGHSSGYAGGNSNQSGSGSSGGDSSDSCVEIRRELTNPYVIQVPAPANEKDVADLAARERLWQARCKPVIRQDVHGVRRYQYAAPGCDYGKYE